MIALFGFDIAALCQFLTSMTLTINIFIFWALCMFCMSSTAIFQAVHKVQLKLSFSCHQLMSSSLPATHSIGQCSQSYLNCCSLSILLLPLTSWRGCHQAEEVFRVSKHLRLCPSTVTFLWATRALDEWGCQAATWQNLNGVGVVLGSLRLSMYAHGRAGSYRQV